MKIFTVGLIISALVMSSMLLTPSAALKASKIMKSQSQSQNNNQEQTTTNFLFRYQTKEKEIQKKSRTSIGVCEKALRQCHSI